MLPFFSTVKIEISDFVEFLREKFDSSSVDLDVLVDFEDPSICIRDENIINIAGQCNIKVEIIILLIGINFLGGLNGFKKGMESINDIGGIVFSEEFSELDKSFNRVSSADFLDLGKHRLDFCIRSSRNEGIFEESYSALFNEWFKSEFELSLFGNSV